MRFFHLKMNKWVYVWYCNKFEVGKWTFYKMYWLLSVKRCRKFKKYYYIWIINQLRIADISIVAQTYDGACEMLGTVGGLQTKIREKYPTPVYFHQYAAH